MKDAKEEMVPGLEAVEEWKARAEELRERAAQVELGLNECTQRLGALLAEGKGDGPEAEALRADRGALRDELEELQAALPALEDKIRTGRLDALREAARARLVGIARARGSLADAYDRKDGARVLSRARAFSAAVAEANKRWTRIRGLDAEADALASRFDLPQGERTRILPPRMRGDLNEALSLARAASLRDSQLWDGRTVPKDSPGAGLLELAGPTEEERAAREAVDQKAEEEKKWAESLFRQSPALQRAAAMTEAKALVSAPPTTQG